MASCKPLDINGLVNVPDFTPPIFSSNIAAARMAQGSAATFEFDEDRMQCLNHQYYFKSGRIIYWMTRDFRVQDNWAMIYAQKLARENNSPLTVCILVLDELEVFSGRRQVNFLCDGLELLLVELRDLKIDLVVLDTDIKGFRQAMLDNDVAAVVTDFHSLKNVSDAQKLLAEQLIVDNIGVYLVDAHNIVPVWVASDKQEYMAKTLRPKINGKLDEYLVGFPQVHEHPHYVRFKAPQAILLSIEEWRLRHVDGLWLPDVHMTGGSIHGIRQLHLFLTEKLHKYGVKSNDPTLDFTSGLSPWLNFGFVSAQRVALEVKNYNPRSFATQIKAFLEELIIRRELADNYCYYNRNYDNFAGAPEWAKKSLLIHAKDTRAVIYSLEQLQDGETADIIWNAAQRQLIHDGKIHGYMRMYWAKKLLEWTETPHHALEIGMYLNNRYSIDGNDPNGYVGVMWSICGLHDQGFKERKIYGKIRYMADYQLPKKFDMTEYCRRYQLIFKPVVKPKSPRGRKRKQEQDEDQE